MGAATKHEEGIALEQEELTRLFQAYADDVFRLACSFLDSRSDAEDICQTVFLHLAEGRGAPEAGSEKACLLTCTANLCRNHLKSFWKRKVQELPDNLTFRDPEDRALHDAVRSLPPSTGLSSISTTSRATTRKRLGRFCTSPGRRSRRGCSGPETC